MSYIAMITPFFCVIIKLIKRIKKISAVFQKRGKQNAFGEM